MKKSTQIILGILGGIGIVGAIFYFYRGKFSNFDRWIGSRMDNYPSEDKSKETIPIADRITPHELMYNLKDRDRRLAFDAIDGDWIVDL